jgi:eukaryotic-like serine/threonine-protein kinase
MTGDDNDPPPPEDRTVFSPAANFEQAPSAPAPPPMSSDSSRPKGVSARATSDEPQRIQIGDVLNHIFEVRRFIARGGMGEVFEGINVNSDERVAIKVILPHLAADESVLAMFRKEARTLTRLGHPALVQYRVLAQEPQLGVFYIVTEYIDGQNLSDILSGIEAGPEQLAALTKRLAEGLAAAHALGAIHRDISPDNVMLEEGRLERAKIIDFGIAKDLDPGSATIVGDGFAGKLNYVAPEQLGDFDRSVGPWTDVYSLALTILAVARRRDVDMGGTLVDAVDKRRAGPDLSPIPETLRPAFEKMLKPNPAERARSMEEVIHLLSSLGVAATSASATPPAKPPKPKGEGMKLPVALSGKKGLMIGGGVGAAALAAVLAFTMTGGGDEPIVGAAPSGETPAPADPLITARVAMEAGLPTVSCAWLDLVDSSADGNSISLTFRGVAGKPADAQGIIGQLLTAKGLQAGSINFNDVSPIDARECGPLEAFRQVRETGANRLTVAQRSFEMVKLGEDAGTDAGKIGAKAVIQLDLNGFSSDLALVGVEGSGEMTEFVTQRSDVTQNPDIEQPQPGNYRFTLNTTHTGWSGILMLTGTGPFDQSLLSGPVGSRGADWPAKFLAQAKQRDWKAEMVWYRTVDAVPN